MSLPTCFGWARRGSGYVGDGLASTPMNVADPRVLREVLRRHGVRAATSLGQRFLIDRSVLAAIVDAAELSPADDVLEVGPGPGVLTAALAARVRSVTAVEVHPPIVALRTRPEPVFAPLGQEPFLRLVSDAFRHRRKQMRSALGHEAGLDRERATDALRRSGVAPERRPETLTLDEWVALARAIGVAEQ